MRKAWTTGERRRFKRTRHLPSLSPEFFVDSVRADLTLQPTPQLIVLPDSLAQRIVYSGNANVPPWFSGGVRKFAGHV